MEDKVQVSNSAQIAQNCLLCAVRPDLADCGLRIPIGNGSECITEDDYQNFPYRWVDDDIFQVFFKGEWKNAYSADFVFV